MMAFFRFALTIFAIALIVFGVIMTISPIPFGFVFVVLGFLLLAAVAPAFLRWFRKRWRWLDRKLDRLQETLPGWLARHLRKSDIDHDDEEKDEDDEEEKSAARR